ncbi:MAG: hypothetical protein RL103_150, partial [Pseudomonadota bacterium]|jgi:hypothetical protein
MSGDIVNCQHNPPIRLDPCKALHIPAELRQFFELKASHEPFFFDFGSRLRA